MRGGRGSHGLLLHRVCWSRYPYAKHGAGPVHEYLEIKTEPGHNREGGSEVEPTGRGAIAILGTPM